MASNVNVVCSCCLPADLHATQRSGDNQGRQFYACCKPRTDPTRCSFFLWKDAVLKVWADSSTSSATGGPSDKQDAHKLPISKINISYAPPDRLLVSCGYRDDLITLFRSVHGRFLPDKKAWAFASSVYTELIAAINTMPRIDLTPLPPHIIPLLSKGGVGGSAIPGDAAGEPVNLRIPTKLKDTLLHFQTTGVEFCLQKSGKAMICDEMGCGKTLTALAVACHYAEEWPLLVICPSSLRLNWRDECLKYIPGISEANICLIKTKKDPITVGMVKPAKLAAAEDGIVECGAETVEVVEIKAGPPASKQTGAAARGKRKRPTYVEAAASDEESGMPQDVGTVAVGHGDHPVHDLPKRYERGVVIVSYDLVASMAQSKAILPGKFNVIIADESHSLKSGDAKRTQACTPILQKAKRTLLLSGTPALNRPRELFTQIAAVQPSLFPSYMEFATRYCAGGMRPWGFDDSGASHLDELRGIMEKHCMIRRLKADILRDLPPKRRRVFQVTMTKSARERVALLKAELNALNGSENSPQLVAKRKGILANMYKTSGVGKLPSVAAHILSMIKPLGRQRGIKRARVPTAFDGIDDDVAAILDLEEQVAGDDESDAEGGGFLVEDDEPAKRSAAPDARENDAAVRQDDVSAWSAAFAHAAPAATSDVEASQSTDGGGHASGAVTKMIVFGHHKEVLSFLEQALLRNDPPISYVRIDGDTPPHRKQQFKNAFQDNPAIQVALVGLTAAGVGLTFTAAATAVFAELHWTPGILAQAEDRIHRIGQRARLCDIQYLICDSDGVDKQMWNMVVRKLETINSTLNADHSAPAEEEDAAPAAAVDELEGIDSILTSEHANVSDFGDVSLSDAQSFSAAGKGGMQTTLSPHITKGRNPGPCPPRRMGSHTTIDNSEILDVDAVVIVENSVVASPDEAALAAELFDDDFI